MTRLVVGPFNRVEGDLEHQAAVGLAHRAEAVDRVLSHMAVDLLQFLVGEARIGLADREQLAGVTKRDWPMTLDGKPVAIGSRM